MALLGLNVISNFKYKFHYRSRVLRYVVEKAIESEFSLTLSKFYMFYVHVLYTQCSKHPFRGKQAAIKAKC